MSEKEKLELKRVGKKSLIEVMEKMFSILIMDSTEENKKKLRKLLASRPELPGFIYDFGGEAYAELVRILALKGWEGWPQKLNNKYRSLYKKISASDSKQVKEICKNFFAKQKQIENFFFTIKNGKIDDVKSLLDADTSLAIALFNGFTPLQYAVREKRILVIKLLLEKLNETQINAQNELGASAIHFAIETDPHIVKMLLSNPRVSLDMILADGRTLLEFTASVGNIASLNLLFDKLNPKPIELKKALYIAIQRGHFPAMEVIIARMKSPLTIDLIDDALNIAAAQGYADAVETLLKSLHKTDIPKIGISHHLLGYNMFHLAVFLNQEKVVERLMQVLGDQWKILNVPSENDRAFPLQLAFEAKVKCKPSLLKLLLDHLDETEINVLDPWGANVLHLAVKFQQAPMVEVILQNGKIDLGAKLNFLNTSGVTALHLAAELGDDTIVKLLLAPMDQELINAQIETPEGKISVLMIAIVSKNLKATQALLASEKLILDPKTCYSGQTILHQAVIGGDKIFVQLLLDHNIPIDCQNSKGHTAFDLAAKIKPRNSAIIKLLQDAKEKRIATTSIPPVPEKKVMALPQVAETLAESSTPPKRVPLADLPLQPGAGSPEKILTALRQSAIDEEVAEFLKNWSGFLTQIEPSKNKCSTPESDVRKGMIERNRRYENKLVTDNKQTYFCSIPEDKFVQKNRYYRITGSKLEESSDIPLFVHVTDRALSKITKEVWSQIEEFLQGRAGIKLISKKDQENSGIKNLKDDFYELAIKNMNPRLFTEAGMKEDTSQGGKRFIIELDDFADNHPELQRKFRHYLRSVPKFGGSKILLDS